MCTENMFLSSTLWYIIDFMIKFYSHSKGAYATITVLNKKIPQLDNFTL